MNLLFYLDFECCPSIGGIERITDILVSGFSYIYQHKVFCIYKKKIHKDVTRTEFANTYHVPNATSSAIAEIIRNNKIDIIINQEYHWDSALLHNAVKLSGRKCAIIYVLHSAPMRHALEFVKIKHVFKELMGGNKKALLKLCFYPLYKRKNLSDTKRYYRNAAAYSDKIVLLSKEFIDDWQNIIGDNESSKISVIPNISSFDTFASTQDIAFKQPKVLFVGRLTEPVKRVGIILEIWRKIESDNHFSNWALDIVGYGEDKSHYEKFVADHNLKRVSFYGQQNPEPYYKRSSIFLMTSAFEGWPMTLTEASQFGCVPMAFNTFASLSDIIKNGENGFIVEEGMVDDYEKKLKNLMESVELRTKMAYKAVEMSRRYDKPVVLDLWNNLFKELNLK
jgi:hypothetical protein